MNSWLKKVGQIIATGLELLTGIEPFIARAYPQTATAGQAAVNDLTAIANIVVQMEAVGASLGLAGADKLRAATGPVVQILMQSELIAGKPITDPAALTTAAQNIINGVVAALNAIHANAAISTPLPKAP